MARFLSPDSTKPLEMGIIGMGAMGKGLLYQSLVTPGMKCLCVAEIALEKTLPFIESLGIEYRIVDSPATMIAAIDAGVLAVCEDGDLVAACEPIDVLIEATSAIIAGLEFSETALKNGKHLVLMNAEIDLIFGPHLLRMARENGVAMTSCDGDQHGVIRHLIDDLRHWGFDLVMGGNIKGFLDRSANPVSIIPEADKRNLDYKMCASYTDGTKLNIEMALLANALGMKTHVTGMHGPRARHVREALELLPLDDFRASGVPIVDYVLGAEPDGGVFAIGRCDHPWQQGMLKYYKLGNGPYYLFYRPYHLCHVEAMQCVFDVAYGKSLLEPLAGFQTNVFAYAKKDLQVGTELDGIGGHTCYGLIENTVPHQLPSGVPICLAENVILKSDVAEGQPLLLNDVAFDANRLDFRTYLNCYAAPSKVLAG